MNLHLKQGEICVVNAGTNSCLERPRAREICLLKGRFPLTFSKPASPAGAKRLQWKTAF